MMNKLLAILLSFFPILALADSSLSFAPPPSDYSVVFLGNIFGIVDGVLHGTGSQIMGAMFSVFNSAVLALGGIVIMYTLLVSTMNTAHEGQMLGQKWSSIWIPVRSTMGLALLIPKQSGYCLMQIFVMWVVVQGVGAADKIWDAALSYLNRGGVIIQAQMDPTKSLTSAGDSGIPYAAQVILAGQVCMIGLQAQLNSQLQIYQAQAKASGGPCFSPALPMKAFCNTNQVPSFVGTVDLVAYQDKHPKDESFTVKMPNFSEDSPFYALNGICGKIAWKPFPKDKLTNAQEQIPSLTNDDVQTASKSRVIALAQMYMDLASVAQAMVGNDPLLGKQNYNQTDASGNFAPWAVQQFGVPQTAAGSICPNSTTQNCISWGGTSNGSNTVNAPMFNGTEFPGAILDYNGIMLPTLNLVMQAANSQAAKNGRAFIQSASTEGWIMAGSYFFNLVNLNVQASQGGANNLTDSDTGLQDSDFSADSLTSAFSPNGCQGDFGLLCTWLNHDVTKVEAVRQLIDGTPPTSTSNQPPASTAIKTVKTPVFTGSASRPVDDNLSSVTVYGYTNNSTILQLPGQPGFKPLMFAHMIDINPDTSIYHLPKASFDCGWVWFGFAGACVGSLFGNLFYNGIFVVMYNFFLDLFGTFITQTINAFLEVPLQGIAEIFQQGLAIIATPGVNPVVALAQMGTFYINFAASFWLSLITMSIVASLIPIFGIFIFALISLALPIILAWIGIMLQIGFTTAYYVPILPYMIFTFGSISWLMAVIEAMVAAPIVALGVTHPEGHDAFGKGEQAILILMNVFLRPAMMIIGYITAISLTYVSVWIINAGFDNAIGFMQGSTQWGTAGGTVTVKGATQNIGGNVNTQTITGGYSGWAGVFAYFFSILIYTMLYLTVVQKSFTLISALPDKVLRWIGGQQESYGADTAQWGQEVQSKIGEAGKDTGAGQAQMDKALQAYGGKAVGKLKKGMSGSGGGKVGATPE